MVDGGGEDGADDGADPVDKVVVIKGESGNGRAKCSRWVEATASVWDCKQVAHCHRQPHGQGGVQLEKGTAVQ